MGTEFHSAGTAERQHNNHVLGRIAEVGYVYGLFPHDTLAGGRGASVPSGLKSTASRFIAKLWR